MGSTESTPTFTAYSCTYITEVSEHQCDNLLVQLVNYRFKQHLSRSGEVASICIHHLAKSSGRLLQPLYIYESFLPAQLRSALPCFSSSHSTHLASTWMRSQVLDHLWRGSSFVCAPLLF